MVWTIDSRLAGNIFLFSLTLFIVYATNMVPPPSIALTGSPALRNFLITASIGGGDIVISSLLLFHDYHEQL